MIRRFALLPIAMLIAGTVSAQTVPAAPPPVASPGPTALAPQPAATVQVTLTTSEGPIVLLLDKDKAPVTTANFLHYVDTKRFDGTTFYRAVKVQPGFGLVQGGINQDPKKAFPPIKHEPTTQTGLTHADGTISMARRAPGTAQGDFFIMVGASNGMDANPSGSGDNQGYAAFGHVIHGMDLVRKFLEAPTDPKKGAASGMTGQIIAAPIKILTARRTNTVFIVPPPAAAPAAASTTPAPAPAPAPAPTDAAPH
jgi:peptidyl-prolyl cis-trans isomerase A (cyclophilin A)